MLTSNAIKGTAIGVQFMSFFGAVWLLFALAAYGSFELVRALPIAATALLLLSGAQWLKRAAGNFPSVAEDRAARRQFLVVNALQWGAGVVLYQILHWMGLEVYFLTGLVVLVGLHFFALAGAVHNPAANGTGAILVVWAVGAWAFAPHEHLQSLTALGAGLILWQAGATALASMYAAVRRFPAPSRSAPGA